MAAEYTAAVAPTRPPEAARFCSYGRDGNGDVLGSVGTTKMRPWGKPDGFGAFQISRATRWPRRDVRMGAESHVVREEENDKHDSRSTRVRGGRRVSSRARFDAHLEEPVDAADGELEAGLDGAGGGLLLVAALHGALGALAGEAFAGEALSALARHVASE